MCWFITAATRRGGMMSRDGYGFMRGAGRVEGPMKKHGMRRRFVAMATGAILVLVFALAAGPVAADRDGAEPSSSAEPTASTDQPAWPQPIVPGVTYGAPVTSYYPPGY